MMLIDSGASKSIVTSGWLKVYLRDAKISKEDVKKRKCARKENEINHEKYFYPGDHQKRIQVNQYLENGIHLKPEIKNKLQNICLKSRSLWGK